MFIASYSFIKKEARNYINYLFVLLIFLFPFDVLIMNWIPPLILLLWLIEGDFKNKWQRLKKCKIFWGLVLFVFVMLFSTLINPPYNKGIYPHSFFNGFDLIFRHYLLLFLLIPIAVTDLYKKTIQYMVYSFIFSMFVSEIKSYLIYFRVIKGDYNNPTPFLSHSFYTAFLAFTIVMLIDNLFKIKNVYLKIFDLLFIITATTNLFVNGGRIGQVTFVFLILFYLGYKFKKNLKIIFAGLLILPIIYVMAYKISPVFKQRMNTTFETVSLFKNKNSNFYNTSFGKRVLMWKICLDDFKENFSFKKFLFGNGFGKSKKEYLYIKDKYYKKYPFINHLTHPHSMYVYLFFSGGIVLLIIYLYILYLFFRLNFFEFDVYAKTFGVTLFFISFTEDTLYRVYGMLFFVLFAGMFYAYRKIIISTCCETSNTHRDIV